MSETNDLNNLLTNIAADFVVSVTRVILSEYFLEILRYLHSLKISKHRQTFYYCFNLCSYIYPKISKKCKSQNGLPHNNCKKNYEKHSKPDSDFNKVAHTKMCIRRENGKKLAHANKDILQHMTSLFFRDLKDASVTTEPKETLVGKCKVIDTEHKTVDLNDSSLIIDGERCAKLEPPPYTTIKQNDSKHADSETQPLDLLVKNKLFIPRTPMYHVYMTEAQSHPQIVNGISWNLLKSEQWRLVTFAQYPHTAQKSAILLANGGFAYYGSGRDSDDTVICYFCARLKRGWLSSDDIQETHRNLSPDCCMVTGVHCNNIPMTVPMNGESLFFQFYNSDKANGNTIKGSGYIQNNELECDSAESNTPAASRNNPVTQTAQASRDVESAHISEFATGANQTEVRSDISNVSMSQQEAARNNTTHNQLANNSVSSSAVSSNNNSLNSSSASAIPNRTQTFSSQQGSTNNASSTETAAAAAVPFSRPGTAVAAAVPFSRPGTAVQSSASAGSQNVTVQAAASPLQVNPSTQSSAPAAGATSLTSSSQPQGNTSESITGTSQNTGQNNAKGPTYGELGIITERPKRIEYAVTVTRLASFEHWPRDHKLKIEDLSAAGFYYAGYGDCARCFYCGGGLRNWEDDDNVWVEHARWFPKCAYIRQTIGQQFVDTVQDLNKSCDKITFTMVTDKMGSSAAAFQLDTRNMPLKRDPAVLTVMEMGYLEQDVIEAANHIKEKYGVLSSDKIFEKLEKDGKSRGASAAFSFSDSKQKLQPGKDEKVMEKLKEENGQLRQQTICKICMDKEVAVVFLPCGHFVSCTDCAAAMKDCPVCRKQVRGIVRAFMG